MNRRSGFERRRADGLRYPRRAILYVRIYWLEQRRASYAAGGAVLECGHADTVHQKGAPTREMERTHMRCRFCDPIARLVGATLAVLFLFGCSGQAFTASELGELGGSSSSAAGVAGAELERAGAPAMGGAAGAASASVGGAGASSSGMGGATGGVAGAELGGAAGVGGSCASWQLTALPTDSDATLCGCKAGAVAEAGCLFCPVPAEGCTSIVCSGDTGHCHQLCGGVCK